MECGDYDGGCAGMSRRPSGVGLQLNFYGSRGVPVAGSGRMPRHSARDALVEPAPTPLTANLQSAADTPFMNDMDEISYWIYTKRAPCLMTYDKIIKKRSEEAQCSKTVMEQLSSPRKKKKKRKLSMLDEDSVSTQKEQNVYFEVAQKQILPMLNTCESESLGSDIDFNLTKPTAKEKAKKARLQKNSRAKICKKSKIVTSTPKPPVNLRRSLRHVQPSGNNVLMDSSFEIFNSSVVSNGHVKNNLNQKTTDKANKSTQMLAAEDADQTLENKKMVRNRSKTTAHVNGEFEDMSDVSGFTANYIRSTKVQSGKNPKKLKCKSNRNLVKETQQSPTKAEQKSEAKMVMCVSKAMNTGVPNTNMLNCSTDSSQNIINLVTTKSHNRSTKLDKSTSLLKFVDTKTKSKEEGKVESKRKNKRNINISFQSQSSATSRYPKRYKNHTDLHIESEVNIRTRVTNKNCLEYNHSDKKENPEEKVVSRTRSGRNISSVNQHRENSVLVVNNSSEQVSSLVSMNVASPLPSEGTKRRATRPSQSKKVNNKSGQSLKRDSVREKSGYTMCFSDSEDDSVPLVQKKYFCN